MNNSALSPKRKLSFLTLNAKQIPQGVFCIAEIEQGTRAPWLNIGNSHWPTPVAESVLFHQPEIPASPSPGLTCFRGILCLLPSQGRRWKSGKQKVQILKASDHLYKNNKKNTNSIFNSLCCSMDRQKSVIFLWDLSPQDPSKLCCLGVLEKTGCIKQVWWKMCFHCASL